MKRSAAAFTLLELLLAMTAGMAVLLCATALLGETGAKCGRLRGGVAARREFRFTLAEWSSDLATAVRRLEFRMEPGASEAAGKRIGFFLLQPLEKQSATRRLGDLCAVTYYLKDLETQGRSVRCLMRGLRDSAEVYAALQSESVEPLFTPRAADEPVAFGVASFDVRPKQRGAEGGWEDWSAGSGVSPQLIEWRLEVVRRELEARLETPAQWDALVVGNDPSQAKHIEVRTGTTAFGHEGIR